MTAATMVTTVVVVDIGCSSSGGFVALFTLMTRRAARV